LQRNTETLTELISDLLDISKIAAGTLTLSFEAVDFKDIVSSSVETLRAQATEKGIALETFVEIPEEIGCTVLGDEVRLEQILANILSNALKFTPNGGAVTVHLRKAEATAILVVKDTGIGMPPDFIPHAFEQFTQAKSSTAENRGMGIGLAICKHLVELHNGSISAESEGLENVRHLELEVGWLPSIAFTASARNEDRVRSRRAGFQAHLVKPVIPHKLVTTIIKLVMPEAT
jgi:signal transduction histidine kinase